MRQQLFEKLIRKMDEHKDDHETLKNLIVKGKILMDRNANDASVVREISNW